MDLGSGHPATGQLAIPRTARIGGPQPSRWKTGGRQPGHAVGRGESLAADDGPSGGWHWGEWLAEAVGTAVLFGAGFIVVAALISPRSPIADAVRPIRFLLVGLNFGILSALITISPIGRRSGAHLNPAVTVAFWLRRDVHPHDLAGYLAAQFTGAVAGTVGFSLVAGAWAESIHHARTSSAPVGALGGVAIEAGLTLGLLIAVFTCLARPRLMRWTPAILGLVLAGLIWVGSPLTGASLNPARSLAPALIEGNVDGIWIYFAGPVLGAALAVALTKATRAAPLTAKIFHGSRCRCHMRCALRSGGNDDGPAGSGAIDRTVRVPG